MRRAADREAMVSPPTRGWTGDQPLQYFYLWGFPAHAGMDRERERRMPPVRRFPRPRGDGPRRTPMRSRIAPVSPPTRGWTAARHTVEGRPPGFPAHAGMDPSAPWQQTSPGGFPRPRGDGPTEQAVLAARLWWFPRPRGDGPTEAKRAFTEHWVSPPTRGWTPEPERACRCSLGFPAHAGMDLTSPPNRADVVLVSPPTRGWTRVPIPVPVVSAWFPRPRGDGPR